MKFSKNWLQQWLPQPLETTILLQQLPMAGHEIEQVEPVAGKFSGVIVAKVLETMQHPNADRLKLCKVDTGTEILNIVCGGKNVRAGLKVPLAQIGAQLPNDLTIRKGKIRGEESMGMICSEVELGLAETADGIMELPDSAPMGQNLVDYLQLDDISIDVTLTPNRGDCLSIMGLAREVAAINNFQLKTMPMETIAPKITETFPIAVMAPEACPRYVGRIIRNINFKAETPMWMQELLRRSGIRSISPVVDVTNYVLLELGQPLHAFDLEKLNAGIEVRFARDKEELIVLNGEKINLDPQTLIIADKKAPLAIAGVMGGQASGCSETTRHIFLESAFFTPEIIAGRARKYGLLTDSSHRFERGVDPELQIKAIERATQLLLEIVGGEPGPIAHQVNENYLPSPRTISLQLEKVNKILGLSLEGGQVTDILSRLHLKVTDSTHGWQVTIPSYRFDLHLDVDLIEEIARLYGYNQIPLSFPLAPVAKLPKETQIDVEQIRQTLASRGYQEVYTYSFVDPNLQKLLEPKLKPLDLTNPIAANMAVMRTSLWAGLLQTVIYNQNRQQKCLRLFEIGQCYVQNDQGELKQKERVAGIITDLAYPEQWGIAQRPADFFDIKGDVEALLKLTGREADFWRTNADPSSYQREKKTREEKGGTPLTDEWDTEMLDSEQADVLNMYKKNIDKFVTVGRLGVLDPSIQKQLFYASSSWRQKKVIPILMFEIELEALTESTLPNYKSISEFPPVRRDLALVLDQNKTTYQLETAIKEAGGDLIIGINIVDVYMGKGIPEGKKSVAVALTLQHQQRTLVDDEVEQLMAHIISKLQEQPLSASLRG